MRWSRRESIVDCLERTERDNDDDDVESQLKA